MGRPERPIDPAAGPVAEFADELRKLREKAGRPSYRELARRASFSVTVLSEAAGGRSLPTLQVVRGYVRACGGDVPEWEERWRNAADQQREESADAGRPAPYLGLACYEVEQASLFFGRDALTGELLRRLAAGRFLAVFGPSGSGKSSLLRAGLLAAVDRGELTATTDWVTILLTPGEQPVAELARALDGKPADAELLLVVDQFEELFTRCRDPAQRDQFVQGLLGTVAERGARTRVVLGVRADFYAHCATWPGLVAALRDAQVLVGPMEPEQLREVIVKPAEYAGMTVEGALVATALAEAGTEPGALALVSRALLETWRYSPPGRLTLAAYTEAGGVPHALASTAERIYADCSEGQRTMLRRIFLRLVTIGESIPDTKRRVTPDELAAGDDHAAAAMLVERLAQARLVTIDDGSLQLAHEALIRFWPRLAEWLAQDRDGLRVQRRVSDAASEWARLGRDPAALYRGTSLAAAQAWARRDADLTGLTHVEEEFLDASAVAEAAGRATAIQTTRRLRRLLVFLGVLLAAVSIAGGIAVWQRTITASAESEATSARLAAQSTALASVNPDAATLAALAAWHAKPTVAARSALLSTTACCTSTQTSLRGEHATVSAVALSPDGNLLAAGGQDRAVHLWNSADGRQLAVLRGFAGAVSAVAFSPNGSLLAAGSADRTIRLWNPVRRTALGLLTGDTGGIEDLAFSPSGALLASASSDGQVRLWNPATRRLEQVLRHDGTPALSVAFSPDGSMLAAAGDDHTVTLWNITDVARPRIIRELTGATGAIANLAYSPSGTVIAGEEADGDVLLWNLDQGTHLLLRHAADRSRGLAFSRDGTILLTAGSYKSILLWNTATGRLAASEAHRIPDGTLALAYDPASSLLALGGLGGAVQIWQAPVPPFTGSAASVTGLAIVAGPTMIASVSSDGRLGLWSRDGNLITTTSLAADPAAVAVNPDGRLLAVLGTDGTVTIRSVPGLAPALQLRTRAPAADVAFSPDGSMLATAARATTTVWDADGRAPSWSVYSSHGFFDTIAFSPGGGTLAAATNKGSVRIWNARTGRRIAQANPVTGSVNAIAFSPGGGLLATGGNDGRITLWNPANLHRVAVLAGPVGSVQALAFSPDGQTLASGEGNGAILLWNVAHRSLTATLTGNDGGVSALAFTPDGSTLFSGDSSSRIIAWNLDASDVVREDCRTLAGDPGLTQAETLVPGISYSRLCPKAR